MEIKRLILIKIFLISILNYSHLYGNAKFSQKVIEKTKNSVVTLKVSSSLAISPQNIGKWEGTGFILNKKKGIILTNAHVAGRSIIGKHDVIFQDGNQADAKVIYYDPWLDFAFLKIEPKSIPKSATEIQFSKKLPKENQSVLIIGNNEGKSFSIHTGNISSLNEIEGIMPQDSIKMSLNTKGGSSGSPVVDTKGEAVSLNYAGSDIFAIGLHPQYLKYAIDYIFNDKIPQRKHIGIICNLYPLSQAVKHRGLDNKYMTEHMKKYPTSNSNILIVDRVLKNSPSEGKLFNGDIIWEIEGKRVGNSLVTLDMALNKSKNSNVKLKIIRNNKIIEIQIDLYNLEKNKIKQMISFNKGVIYKMDDTDSFVTGAESGTISFSYPLYFGQVKILKINNIEIKKLDDILSMIPSLAKNKYFYADIKVYSPIPLKYNNSYLFSHPKIKIDIFYDSLEDPKLYTYNSQSYEWESDIIK